MEWLWPETERGEGGGRNARTSRDGSKCERDECAVENARHYIDCDDDKRWRKTANKFIRPMIEY